MATQTKVIGPISAYAIAVQEGYTGTKEDWANAIGNAQANAQIAQDAADTVEDLVHQLPQDLSDLLEDFAPQYSETGTYEVGDFTIYDGKLRKCITPITTPEDPFVEAHWEVVRIGDEFDALKTDAYGGLLMQSEVDMNCAFVSGDYYVNAFSGTIESNSATDGMRATKLIDVKLYSRLKYGRCRFRYACTGGIAFYDEDGAYISGKAGVQSTGATDYEADDVAIPENARYVRLTAFAEDVSTLNSFYARGVSKALPYAVRYNEYQYLTDEEKQQARTNIDAMSQTDYAEFAYTMVQVTGRNNSQIMKYNACNYALFGSFAGGTNNGVTFAWNSEHTVCTLNGSAGRTEEARNRYLYSETSTLNMKPGETYLFDVTRSKVDTGVDLYWYINGTLGTQTRITEPTYITVPANATGVLSRVYALPASGTLTNETVGIRIMSAKTNKELEEMINGKQDAPESAGTSGQVLGLNSSLNPVWVNLPNPGAAIDDTAGDGATNKVWSADKLTDEFAEVSGEIGAANVDLNNLIGHNSFNYALKYGDFSTKTNRGVTFTWDSSHTVCTLNCSASPSADASARYLYSETGLCGLEIGKTYLFNIQRSHGNTGVDLYWYINGTLGTQTKMIAPTYVTVPEGATGILSRVYVLTSSGALSNATVRVEVLSAASNRELEEAVNGKLDAPSAVGTAGQVLTLNSSLVPEWTDNSGSSVGIDDTAGTGVTDKAWSANKLTGDFQTVNDDLANLKQNNAYDIKLKYGDFATKTNRGVTFTWDSSHTVCTLNCSASPSADAFGRYLYNETGLCGMEVGKKYLFDVGRTHPNTGVDIYWYINGTLGTQTKLVQPTWVTVPANATGVLSRVYALAGVGVLTNAKVSLTISEAPSNTYLNDRIEAAAGNPFLTPTGDTTDRSDEIEAMLTANGICSLAPGDYYVSNIEMPDESVLKGSGIGKTKIYMITGATGSCVKLGSKCSVSEMSLYGQDTDSHGSNNDRHGIGWVGTFVSESNPGTFPLHSYVTGLYIEGFAGGGIYCTNTSMRLLSGLQASNVMIISCWAGVYIKKYAEFSQFTNIKANTCTYGCINNGGNNVFTNCNFSGNTTALLMDDTNSQSPNNSHGSYVGCVFNHSGSNEGYAMTLIGLDSGEQFVGCQVFFGKTSVTDCLGIRFVGCNYGRKTGITVTDSHAVCWDSCQFREATDTPLTQSGSVGVKFRTCMLYDGTDFDPTAT